ARPVTPPPRVPPRWGARGRAGPPPPAFQSRRAPFPSPACPPQRHRLSRLVVLYRHDAPLDQLLQPFPRPTGADPHLHAPEQPGFEQPVAHLVLRQAERFRDLLL